MELIVTLAIFGTLAMLALPSYDDYVMRARRADARDALTAAAQAQERWYSNHSTYAADLATLGFTSPSSPSGHYRIAMQTTEEGGYRLRAEPQGGQSNDACGTFVLDDLGVRTVDNATAPVERCW